MRLLLAALAAAVLLLPAAAEARVHHGHCDRHCIARSQRHYKLHTIRPYVPWLRSTGNCEAGGYSLRSGLRAVGGGGAFRGRYQFGIRSWYAAGGRGDPIDASWLEQAYRAVRWRKIIGNPHTTAGWPVCG